MLSTCLGVSPSLSITAAQESAPTKFTYQTFTVPKAMYLSVESINDSGTISGYSSEDTDSGPQTLSFLRSSDGALSTYSDPGDLSASYTEGDQINRGGTVAGTYFNTAANTDYGFIYQTSAGTLTDFILPDQPEFTNTALQGINTRGDLCGTVSSPPYSTSQSFVFLSHKLTLFSVNGSSQSVCTSLNDFGVAPEGKF